MSHIHTSLDISIQFNGLITQIKFKNMKKVQKKLVTNFGFACIDIHSYFGVNHKQETRQHTDIPCRDLDNVDVFGERRDVSYRRLLSLYAKNS